MQIRSMRGTVPQRSSVSSVSNSRAAVMRAMFRGHSVASLGNLSYRRCHRLARETIAALQETAQQSGQSAIVAFNITDSNGNKLAGPMDAELAAIKHACYASNGSKVFLVPVE